MELNQLDKTNITTISTGYNLDSGIVEKLYGEMLEKAKKQTLFKANLKALIEKMKANK